MAGRDMQISRIKSNHQRIQTLPEDQLQRVFGVRKHHFRLHAPVPGEYVDAYEKKYGFGFPEGYRHFIIEVADGGAGPFYGLKQQFITTGATLRHEMAMQYASPSVYTCDCPNSQEWRERLLGPLYRELEDENEALYYQGTIPLFDVGCGSEGVLVLNGPRTGQVCITDYGFSPFEFTRPAEFLDMYESWQEAVLDEAPSLAGASEGTSFGF
jgi:hypothetical protein